MDSDVAALIWYILQAFGGLIVALSLWLMQRLFKQVDRLQSEITELRIHLPSTYVKISDLKESLSRIEGTLGRIFDKLDTKADKDDVG